MKKISSILLSLIWLATGAAAQTQQNIFFVVDVSGSMAAQLPQISHSISEQADTLGASGAGMGIVTTSGCGKEWVRDLVAFGLNNSIAIKAGASRLAVGGEYSEDLVEVLRHTKAHIQKLLNDKGECANVILFTDDVDTCNSVTEKRHLAILKEIQAMCGPRAEEKVTETEKAPVVEKERSFRIDVVTSTVDEETRLFLDEIAVISGGTVHSAGTVDEISEKIRTIVEGYTKRKVSSPLRSVIAKPEGAEGGGEPKQPTRLAQPKRLPSKQGGQRKSENSKGGT